MKRAVAQVEGQAEQLRGEAHKLQQMASQLNTQVNLQRTEQDQGQEQGQGQKQAVYNNISLQGLTPGWRSSCPTWLATTRPR